MARADVINIRLDPDLGAAFRHAAELNERSINRLATQYLRRCLIEDGYYQPSEGVTAAASAKRAPTPAMTAPEARPPLEPSRPAGRVMHPTPPKLPNGALTPVRVKAIIAAIAVEYREEQGLPLGKNGTFLGELITSTFPDVTDMTSARAKGWTAWIEAGARPGLIQVLYPGDHEALSAAKRQQNRIQMDSRIAAGSAYTQFVSSKGVYGRGSSVLHRIWEGHFPGLSIEEAYAKGAEAWLEAGISEDTARRMFGDAVGDEAKRRSTQRGNANKRRKVKEPEPA